MNAEVSRPSHVTSPTIERASTALAVPKQTMNTGSGRTRRQGSRKARPTVTASEAPRHTNCSRVMASTVASTTTAATNNQSRPAGPGGSAAGGFAQ